MFIDGFKEDLNRKHKVKFINEKKDRVMVLYIENLTKPLYWLFPKRLDSFFYFFIFIVNNKSADFKLPIWD